jgi:hypothetical protein
MSRWFARVVVLVILIGSFAPNSAALYARLAIPTSGQEDPQAITVYITRTGEKYHRDGCQYLRQSRIATTLRDAVKRGYGPCSVCKPPVAR